MLSSFLCCSNSSRTKCKESTTSPRNTSCVVKRCAPGSADFNSHAAQLLLCTFFHHILDWSCSLQADTLMTKPVCRFDIHIHNLVWSHTFSMAVLLETTRMRVFIKTLISSPCVFHLDLSLDRHRAWTLNVNLAAKMWLWGKITCPTFEIKLKYLAVSSC